MSLLITRPRYDKATYYLYYWSGELNRIAEDKGEKVFDLEKQKANKKTLNSYIAKQSPSVVIINGHGNDSVARGENGEVIISADDELTSYKNKKIFIRACNAARVLGKILMKAGARGFVGYMEPFMFFRDPDSFRNPLKDELARPNLESSNQVGASLIKGRSAEEAHLDSVKVYKKNISQALNSKAPSFILPALNWNMMAQVYYDKREKESER